jgi:hypothetical protein
VPRLEASITTPLSFRRNIATGDDRFEEPAETVEFILDGRLFVWHSFPEAEDDPVFGSGPFGPTVTTAIGAETTDLVATEVERLLSSLTWLYDVPTTVAHYGSSFHDDLYVPPPFTRTPRAPGWVRTEPVMGLYLRRDSEGLLKALGWYREGRNAESPYYRFLALWNALEAVFYGPSSRDGRAEFIDRATPALADAWTAYPLPDNPSEHFKAASRDAIAHVFRGQAGALPLIDPDADADRQRLDWESRFLQTLVPSAIREVFSEPVTTSTTR